MAKIITIQELEATQAYKNAGLTFPHPHDLITRVVDKIKETYPSSIEFSVAVDKEGGAKLEDGTDVVTYGRGYFTTNLATSSSDDFGSVPVIGIIWSYDSSKRFIKVFAGVNISACTNLQIVSDEEVITKVFPRPKGGSDTDKKRNWDRTCRDIVEDIVYKVEDYLKDIDAIYKKNIEFMKLLSDYEIKGEEQINEYIGGIFINDIIKGTFDYSTFTEGCRLSFDERVTHPLAHLYLVNTDYEDNPKGGVRIAVPTLNLLKFYGALTQRITDFKVEIDSIPDKTIEVSKLILNSIGYGDDN